MDILPKELWLEVFEYLNKFDLKLLLETCKSFKEMVLNTKLIGKLILNLRGNLEWDDGERKYSQVRLPIAMNLNVMHSGRLEDL